MATPPEILRQLRQAKGQISQPNMQGTRGGPSKGGVAARPATGAPQMARRPRLMGPATPGGGTALGSGGAADPAAKGTAAAAPSGGTAALGAGGPADPLAKASGAAPQFPGFKPRLPELQTLTGGGVPPSSFSSNKGSALAAAPEKPAWQQLQEMGVGGQGSAAGNKAELARRLLEARGGPPAALGGDTAVSGAPGPPAGATPPPPPGADIGPPPNAFPGFKPRLPGGMAGGLQARPMPATVAGGAIDDAVGAYQARPMPGTLPADPGFQVPDETGGAPRGFGDIARAAASMQRLPMRSAVR